MELYGLVMVVGQELVDGRGLMSDGPQEMTVQGSGWYWTWQRDLVNTQLDGEILVAQADACPRVNKVARV